MRLSSQISETTGKPFPIKTLCAVLGVPRSSFYHFKRSLSNPPKPKPKSDRKKPGPKPSLDDQALLAAIRNTIAASPFHSEGYRKIHARLKRAGLKASKHRVLRVMRQANLLSPSRKPAKPQKAHDGTIIPDSINKIWSTDATIFHTATGDRLWLFAVLDHFSNEILGWNIVPVGQGSRWEALAPIQSAVAKIRRSTGQGAAAGISLRHDLGPQFTARDFKREIAFLGFTDSPAIPREPETNGVIERFFRTLKGEFLWVERFENIEHARKAVGEWIETYNTQWLIGRLGHRTPREVRLDCEAKMQQERDQVAEGYQVTGGYQVAGG